MTTPCDDAKTKQNILVIDDDKIILQILARILRRQGYNVDTAETGQEALAKLGANVYSAALIDVKLQDVNGLDILKKISDASPETVRIMLTGHPSDQDRNRALELGAAHYLTKPVQAEKLIKIIENELCNDQTREKDQQDISAQQENVNRIEKTQPDF